MEYIKAFVVGGLICMLVQILMEKTKMMPGRIMVLLVVSGSVLGFLGVYEPFAEWAGAGATVPLLGFGNTLWKGVVKAMSEDGVLGIFKGGFTASAVGISGALVFGYLGAIVFRPGMKEEGGPRRGDSGRGRLVDSGIRRSVPGVSPPLCIGMGGLFLPWKGKKARMFGMWGDEEV